MSLISTAYGLDNENLDFFGGIGRTVLGRNGKYNFMRQYSRINTQVLLVDVTWNELLLVAQNVPHLNTVISTGAAMFSNACIKHLDKNGEEIEDSPVLKLLNKPNPLQNMKSWLYDFYVSNAIYNTSFGYKNYGRPVKYRDNDLPSYMWWLAAGLMKINRTEMLIYSATSMNDLIEDYTLTIGRTKLYTPDEIMLITEGVSNNGIIARSRLEALQLPLSNIVAALKSKNIILTERGLIGFISSDNPKDSDGALPPDEEELKRIQKEYQKDQSLDSTNGHVTFTKSLIKWVPMTFDLNQLQLPEGLEDDFAMICAAYGIHRTVFPLSHVSPRGMTTGTEIDSGLRFTYQNAMLPLLKKLLDMLTSEFGLDLKGEKLTGDYDWLACMKNDELAEAQADQADSVADQNEAALIVSLNTAIKAGNLTTEGAILLLTRENDYDEDEAKKLILAQPSDEEIAANNTPAIQMVQPDNKPKPENAQAA